MKRKTIVMHGRRATKVALALLIGATVMQSCKDDDLILTGQPSWLGNSIYERLQEEGNYTYTLRLIDDLGEKEVLSHTGSRTLFVASDSAYDAWFGNNLWKVKSYDDLTKAQKSLLLKNSMISNAYLIELMSNAKAQGDAGTPEEGRTMRRETSTSIYDSVYVMPWDQMPTTKAWADYRERQKSIPLFKDATAAPMIHFLPAYMSYNKITKEDLSVLTNGQATSVNEAWVNGKKVVERDITCKNGYIQKVSGVIESSPNMAEIVRQQPDTKMWSHLLDRFSAPYYNNDLTREYNRIYNNEDSAFVLRYYSKRSAGGAENSRDPKGDPVTAVLKFDPGWNQYIDANSQIDLHYDAGVLIVPTDSALQAWWDGPGSDLQSEYLEWDSIPENTLAKLINVNMLTTFSEAVPSKFGNVLNDAKEKLGIEPEDIVGCYMGCNGVVYKTNKVFIPAEYASVAYPALAHASTMNVIYWAIDHRNFLPYLLSMDSKYALILPTNNALLTYFDPGSYGKAKTLKDLAGNDSATVETPDLIEFRYDMTKPLASRVQASRYECTVDKNGNVVEKGTRKQLEVAQNVINTIFDGMMDQLIIVIPDKTKKVDDYVNEGYTYFKTKGGAMVHVYYKDNNKDSLAFEGGWQTEHNRPLVISEKPYEKENGYSYQINSEAPMGAQNSVYMTLRSNSEFTGFLNLLESDYCDLLIQKLRNYNPGLATKNNKNLRLLDNYNYNVYVPTTASLQKLMDEKKLPTWDELSLGDDDATLDSICKANKWYGEERMSAADSTKIRDKVKTAMQGIVEDFIRYHVHDNSVAIGMAYDGNRSGKYESMKRNPSTGRFYPITVSYDATSMTVTDAMGTPHQVVTSSGLYNKVCREYWFEGKDNSARLFMASNVVMHQIDSPLCYGYTYPSDYKDASLAGKLVNMRPWKDVVEEALKQ